MRCLRTMRMWMGLVACACVAACITGCGAGSTGDAVSAAGTAQQEATLDNVSSDATDASEAYFLSDYDATVFTEANEATTLTAIAAGKPLLINFWTTWCHYCVEEMPDLAEVVADYGDKMSFAFIDVADGQAETVEQASSWLFEHDLYTLPVYYDTADTHFAASQALGVSAYPTTVIVDGTGEILTITPGALDIDLLRQTLDTLV